MARNPRGKPITSRDEAADYLESLLAELTPLAQRHGLHVVAYLLDMAHLEVRTIMGNSRSDKSGRQ